MIDLKTPCEAMAVRFNLPIQSVANLCPKELVGAAGNYAVRFSKTELEDLVGEWLRAVEAASKAAMAEIVAKSTDAKRLRYFRRRYGPHITMEHLPKGRK